MGPFAHLGPDILAGIRGLKATDGPDLLICGSSTLKTWLLDQGMVDEVVLLVHPVLLGRGNRLFANRDPRELTFVGLQATATGVLLNAYRHVGPLQA